VPNIILAPGFEVRLPDKIVGVHVFYGSQRDSIPEKGKALRVWVRLMYRSNSRCPALDESDGRWSIVGCCDRGWLQLPFGFWLLHGMNGSSPLLYP
jgi:hypothetical protein